MLFRGFDEAALSCAPRLALAQPGMGHLQAFSQDIEAGILESEQTSTRTLDVLVIALGWVALFLFVSYPSLQMVGLIMCGLALGLGGLISDRKAETMNWRSVSALDVLLG